MISRLDNNIYSSINLMYFLKVVYYQKEIPKNFNNQDNMNDDLIAYGGLENGSEHVRYDILINIIRIRFGLTIYIKELINKINMDVSGQIDFEYGGRGREGSSF